MIFDFTDLFNSINLLYLSKVINLQFKKYKNKLNFLNHADANYFQTLTNFIIRNNHYLQNSKLYLQKEKFHRAIVLQIYQLICIYIVIV